MKRKIGVVLLVAVMIITFFPTTTLAYEKGAYTFDIDFSDYTCTITDYDPSIGGYTPTIPSVINFFDSSFTVTKIGYGAFGQSGLTSVSIPNTVTTIDDYAFHRNSCNNNWNECISL